MTGPTWHLSPFELIYLVSLAGAEGLRLPGRLRRRKRGRLVDDRSRGVERPLMAGLLLGVWLLPLVAILTPWLEAADYSLPLWAGWVGVALSAGGLWLRWRAQRALGPDYASSLTVREEQMLVTDGIYRHVRHPIYAALLIWGLAQPLLVQNWAAGPAGLLAIAPLVAIRLPREEAMLLEHFGEAYQAYKEQTGQLLPRWGGKK